MIRPKWSLMAFVVLRTLDGFGNIRPQIGNTWIDYLNVVKYPPSMTFTFLTMGVNLILLSTFAWTNEKLRLILNVLAVFGRVPLFFYTVHLYLYAGLAIHPARYRHSDDVSFLAAGLTDSVPAVPVV